MNIEIKIENSSGKEIKKTIDNIHFQKMMFLYNALEQGWTIKKREGSYFFSKNHEGKKEVFLDSYITNFMKDNMDINKLLS